MPGNRVGLVQAEGTGVTLAPLTLDGGVIDLLLDTIEPGSLPSPGTELAPGLDTAAAPVRRGEREAPRPGASSPTARTTAAVSKQRSPACARRAWSSIAFGIGTPRGAPLPIPGGGVKHDEEGNIVISQLHEDVLENMARATGGSYTAGRPAPPLDPAPVVRASTAWRRGRSRARA